MVAMEVWQVIPSCWKQPKPCFIVQLIYKGMENLHIHCSPYYQEDGAYYVSSCYDNHQFFQNKIRSLKWGRFNEDFKLPTSVYFESLHSRKRYHTSSVNHVALRLFSLLGTNASNQLLYTRRLLLSEPINSCTTVTWYAWGQALCAALWMLGIKYYIL